MEAEKKVMKVFWGQAVVGGSPTWTWMAGWNAKFYELGPIGSWQSQEKAIDVAKEKLSEAGVNGAVIEVYSQGSKLLQTIEV